MITAVLRLKDEAEWLDLCLKTISPVFEEIVLATQGEQKDNTIEICEEWASKHVHIRHVHYEYDSRPNGPGHDQQPYDKYSRAFFYNWAFSYANCPWVCKWDGDMLALPNLKKYLDKAVAKNACLKFQGVDVVGDLFHIGDREFCASEIRLYKNGQYVNGSHSEKLDLRTPDKVIDVEAPLFIHTKWAKSEYSQTKAWPYNWKEIPHFQKIHLRGKRKRKHAYKIPKEWLNES